MTRVGRRAQFFIATIVLIALTISLTAINLYVPKEININQVNINDELINNALFVKQTLKSLGDYFRTNWLLPYTHRTKIKVENNFTLKDYTVEASINLPDGAYTSSLALVDERKKKTPFNVEWSSSLTREGTIYFQASALALEDNYYYLYYNIAPSKTIKESKERMFQYSEDADGILIRTSAYSAWINKSEGGHFKVMNHSGSGESFMNYYDHAINCTDGFHLLNESINQQLTITDMDYYLKLVFTGSRFANETYEITELFFPDEILVIDEMTIAANSSCNFWGSFNNFDLDPMTNYVDDVGNIAEPLLPGGPTYMGNINWLEQWGGDYSIGLMFGNASPLYATVTATESWSEIRFINSTNITKGTYLNNVTIVPIVGGRFNSTKRFNKPGITATNEVFETELTVLYNLLNNYFKDINAVVTYNKSIDIFHESYKNLSDWYSNYSLRDYLYFEKPGGLMPLEASIIMNYGVNPNSIIYYNNGPASYQVSTDNYHSSSSFNNSMNNTVINNSLLLFNPDGQDFNITIIKTSAGELSTYLYYPNSSLVNYYNVNTSPYSILLSTINQSGFYNLTINGTATFIVNTSLPKIIGRLPLELSNNSPIYLLLDEGINNTNLTITTYSSTPQAFTLYDPWNNSIGNTSPASPGTSSINKSIIPCQKTCVYRLEVDNESPFMIDSTTIKYASTNEKYLINPLEPELILINVNDRKKGYTRIYYNNESPVNESPINSRYSSDLNYSEIDNRVNNSLISFDFDDMSFVYKEANWIGTRGWTTCTDTCTNSFSEIKFIEKGSERVVVWTNTSVGVDYYFHFYPNTTYFKVITNSDTNHSFGPDWAVNNTNDTYYSFKDSGIMGLGDGNNYVDKYNLTGPETYIMKNDDNSKAAIIFNTNLLETNNSININDTSIMIRAYIPGTYGFVINEEPSNYLTPTITNQYGSEINYTYITSRLTMNGRLLN